MIGADGIGAGRVRADARLSRGRPRRVARSRDGADEAPQEPAAAARRVGSAAARPRPSSVTSVPPWSNEIHHGGTEDTEMFLAASRQDLPQSGLASVGTCLSRDLLQ